MHGRVKAMGALVVLALLMLGLIASSASATTGHAFSSAFGVAGDTGPGGISGGGPSGIAIEQSSGDVLISDPNNPTPRIERFDAAGTFLSEFPVGAAYNQPAALAVDQNDGAIYASVVDAVAGTYAIVKYSSSGTFAYALNPAGSGTNLSNQIAVDPTSGDVYVSASDVLSGAQVVDVFDNAGVYQSTFDGTGTPNASFGAVSGLGVDSAGRVYVSDGAYGHVERFSAAGAWQQTVDDGSRGGSTVIAVDPVSDEVYSIEGYVQVGWFSAGGAARLETFGSGSIIGGAGVAINHASGTVYVADNQTAQVSRFPTFAGPTVTTGAAASIDPTSETLNGTIDPEGIATTFHFEYGLDPNYGTNTPDTSAGNGNAAVPATDTAAGLQPNTLYHVRLVGTNASGSIYGADQTFTTAPAPPVLDGAGGGAPPFASAITADGATLNGTINPNGSDTQFHFDYGTTTAYGSVTSPSQQTGAGQGDAPFSVPLTGLAAGTTYHFRLNADNGTGGVQLGVDRTFTTAPGTAAGASSVTGITANLSGTVNPHGSATTYHFQWGLDPTAYSNTTPETSAGSGNGNQTVGAPIVGLTPGTTYHVRLIATDVATSITTTGVDGTFTTNPAPTATTKDATNVTLDRATFNGIADTHSLGGSYRFYVESSTSTYIGKTDAVDIPINTGSGSVSGALTDLVPGQTYTVRLSVTSSGVTTLGDTVTFSTPEKPAGPPPAPPTTVDNPYGCVAPKLAAYNARPKPGDTITVGGTDLGVGGTVALGDDTIKPKSWSATGFSIVIPADATGSLALTVNCGTVSNTIAVQMYQAPSNSFTAKGKVKGSTATLSVKVPGPGTITVTGGSVKKATKHAGKAGSTSVKVSLSSAGKKSVKRHKVLTVSLKVKFTPTGGKSASKTVKVTFKR